MKMFYDGELLQHQGKYKGSQNGRLCGFWQMFAFKWSNAFSLDDTVRTTGKREDENPMVATDALDEPLLDVPGASSHSTHYFEWTQKITWPT